MRVMLDTNVLVSIIFFPSQYTRNFTSVLCENAQIVLCDYVVDELKMVTDRKFPRLVFAMNQFIQALSFEKMQTVDLREGETEMRIRDPKDSPILRTAVNGDIDIFVTGDKDFLVLEIEKPKIMTMRQFLDMAEGEARRGSAGAAAKEV